MVKAIETRYKGYRFRSRLEARWAVFMDAAGIQWEYEPEGYDLGERGWYLPDFFLPQIGEKGTWLEIKPNAETDVDAYEKLIALCEGTGCQGIVFKGAPMENVGVCPWEVPGFEDWSGAAIIKQYGDLWDQVDAPYVFCVCPYCGNVGLEFDGRGERVCGGSDKCTSTEVHDDPSYYYSLRHGDKAYSYHHPKLVMAAQLARAARFEHGETP